MKVITCCLCGVLVKFGEPRVVRVNTTRGSSYTRDLPDPGPAKAPDLALYPQAWGGESLHATHSSQTPPRCKPAPENSHPGTIQPLTLADRARRVAAIRAVLSTPAFHAKVQLLNQEEGDRP